MSHQQCTFKKAQICMIIVLKKKICTRMLLTKANILVHKCIITDALYKICT